MRGVHIINFVIVGIIASVCYVRCQYIPTYTACRNGWISYEGNCFFFGKLNSIFSEADYYCQRLDSDLAENLTYVSNAFIKDRMRDLQSRCYWVGLNHNASESNAWKWYTSDIPTNFADWHAGKPANGGDCAVYWPDYGFQWADFPCDMHCAALCMMAGHHDPTTAAPVTVTTHAAITGPGQPPIVG